MSLLILAIILALALAFDDFDPPRPAFRREVTPRATPPAPTIRREL